MMTSIVKSLNNMRSSIGRGINWRLFLQDNITGSWYQAVWVVLLILVNAFFTVAQFQKLTITTLVVLVLWGIGILSVVIGELFDKRTNLSRWLKRNLLNSVSNTLLTLLVALLLVAALNGIIHWGLINATFDSTKTAPEYQPENGATWGVIWGARKLLLTGLLPPDLSWRPALALGVVLLLWALSYISSRPTLKARLRILRLAANTLWIFSPIILYIILAGVPKSPYNFTSLITGVVIVLGIYFLLWWQRVINFSWARLIITGLGWPVIYSIWWVIGQGEIFPLINVDNWGGLMLTLIIASAVIVLSLPLGMVLALGRRSQVYGIPGWIVWPLAIVATIWGLSTTPGLVKTARNLFEQIISFWPIGILILAYMLQRYFHGNVVSGASTTFIELIRSVPLITLLFMGIIMAPFFLDPTASAPARPWPVIIGYTLFSSAYMAETIRGGLQAIPKGQYEAADSLAFNTLQKMRFIILPQALRIVIPAIVGQFIGAFKSSSLVSIVGLFELLGIQKAILANPQWQGLRLELYVSMAIVYFIGSYFMSSYSRRLEVRLSVGQR